MPELHRFPPTETARFMESLGYPIPEKQILQTYPIHFPDRRVFRVAGAKDSEEKVLKVRPDNEEAREELKKLRLLFSSYRYSGGSFPAVEPVFLTPAKYVVFRMSYLGRNLGELGATLDLLERGDLKETENTFKGFSQETIQQLVGQLRQSHKNFTEQYGYVHGDIIQHKVPNNVVFYPELDRLRLYLVDAEALAPADEKVLFRFEQEIERLEEWMCESLLKESLPKAAS